MSRIIILIILLFSTKIYSQDTSILVEYEKEYLVAKNDTLKNLALLGKFNFYLRSNRLDTNTLKTGKRIDYQFIVNKDSLNRFLWNMALVALLNDELNYAINYESKYVTQSKDTSVEVQLLNYFIYKKNSNLRRRFVNNLVQFDSVFVGLNCLDSIYIDDENFKKYITYSKILPGLGTYLLGEKVKGITSFFINGLTTFGLAALIKHKLYVNAIGFTLVYWLKFYQGSALLTEEIIHHKIAKNKNDFANECEVVLRNILIKYPLKIK